MQEILDRLAKSVLEKDAEAAEQAAKDALEAGIPPMEAMNEGAAKGMEVVGEKFNSFEYFLPDLMQAGKAMKAAVAILLGAIPKEETAKLQKGKVVIASVAGDVHDIGKNIVGALLSANGFDVIDLGVDVAAKEIYKTANEQKADIIALSTLLTTSMPFQQDIISYLEDSNTRDQHFVIVGGGPVVPEWAEEIGSDGYGRSAAHAVDLCKALVESEKKPPLANTLIFDIEQKIKE